MRPEQCSPGAVPFRLELGEGGLPVLAADPLLRQAGFDREIAVPTIRERLRSRPGEATVVEESRRLEPVERLGKFVAVDARCPQPVCQRGCREVAPGKRLRRHCSGFVRQLALP